MDNNKRPRIGTFNSPYDKERSGFNRNDDRNNRNTIDLTLVNGYMSRWINQGADDELVQFAEKAGKAMADGGLTNSKIRSIYGEIKRIQSGDFEKLKSSFYLLKPKVAYAVGRDSNNKGLKLFQAVFNKCYADVKDKHSYENFCNFIEAILAYHSVYVEDNNKKH